MIAQSSMAIKKWQIFLFLKQPIEYYLGNFGIKLADVKK